MKQADIVTGEWYLTKVCGEMRKVRVIMSQKSHPKGMRYAVKDETGKILPKYRTAAALHPLA